MSVDISSLLSKLSDVYVEYLFLLSISIIDFDAMSSSIAFCKTNDI